MRYQLISLFHCLISIPLQVFTNLFPSLDNIKVMRGIKLKVNCKNAISSQ